MSLVSQLDSFTGFQLHQHRRATDIALTLGLQSEARQSVTTLVAAVFSTLSDRPGSALIQHQRCSWNAAKRHRWRPLACIGGSTAWLRLSHLPWLSGLGVVCSAPSWVCRRATSVGWPLSCSPIWSAIASLSSV